MNFSAALRSHTNIYARHRKIHLVGLRCYGVACFMLLFVAFTLQPALAQSVHISVLSASPARLKIEGQRASPARTWSFLNNYAGVMRLGERIENLRLADASGASISTHQLAPGEYEAASPATLFSYEVKLEPPANQGDASHISWLAGSHGFLMLGDLLPHSDRAGNASASKIIVRFSLPPGWSIAANETKQADGQFALADAESAVFFVGQDLRESLQRIGPVEFTFVTTGDWSFTDKDAANLAASIIKDYLETTGNMPRPQVMLMLAPFPGPVSAERWSAETRAGTVALLSGRSPSKVAGLAQLSVPLTHELFHLWIPNALSLDGEYDWFYEGFTMYQAMRTAMRLNYLTFQDYLNTLGRAFDVYRSAPDHDKLSLIDASKRRWTNTQALVYNKGMLIAFLYDLQLRMQTGGKRSLDDIYRHLFHLYRGTEKRADANTAVIAALSQPEGMQDFVRQYVETPAAIELEAAIAPFGLHVEPGGVRTHVAVANSLSRSQRDLLSKIGYNAQLQRAQERARKLSLSRERQ